MKTNRKNQSKNQSGLQSRPEQQQSTATAAQPPAALIPETTEQAHGARAEALHIDFAQRRANRELPTEQVLDLLQRRLRPAFEVAEVVGKWIWVAFSEKQPQQVTAELSQLGFHWNNRRQVWQHPCGVFKGEPVDPRAKYQTVPAQQLTA